MCLKNYTSSRGAHGNLIYSQIHSAWMPDFKLNKDYDFNKVKGLLNQIKKFENDHNSPDYQIKNWDFENSNYNSKGYLTFFPELKNSFDQDYQIYVFNNIAIHKPSSPDIINFEPRVYLFSENGLLKTVMKLDEWLLLKFKEKFGNQIRLFRTMSHQEAQLFANKDYATLEQEADRRHNNHKNSYNSSTPVFHFMAEKPIGWTTDKDHVLAIDFKINELLTYVKSGQIKVGYAYEIQIESQLIHLIMPNANVTALPAFNFSHSQSSEINKILSQVK